MLTTGEKEVDPKVVLALIPDDRGRFVLIRRLNPQAGMGNTLLEWVFPGGTIEGQETPEEAVVREAKEEVGLSVEVVEKLLARKHPNTFVAIGYYHCGRMDLSELPRIYRKEEEDEVAQIELVEASEVLGFFTTDVHPRIRDFILSFVPKKAPATIPTVSH